MMIARPTATSAAATTNVKNTITWPSGNARKETNVSFAALSISSMHMNITSVFLRDQSDCADGEQHRREDQVVGRGDVFRGQPARCIIVFGLGLRVVAQASDR